MSEIVEDGGFAVNIDEIESIDPLPKQTFRAIIEGLTVKEVERKDKEGEPTGEFVTKVMVGYRIPTSEYPPNYDIENAPEGVKLYTNFAGQDVDCGGGATPTRRGMARWKVFLKQHGYKGELRFKPREDLDGKWSVTDDCLQTLDGTAVLLTIAHHKYQGETRQQIGTIKPVD